MSARRADRRQGVTRARLLDAAARLFAQRGYAQVTIRDICAAANANIAAVNYHFANKDALYSDVVRLAVSALQASTQTLVATANTLSAEERITGFVRAVVDGFADTDQGWLHQLLLREIAEPTPALEQLTAEVIAPQFEFLQHAIGDVLGCNVRDPRVVRCAFSIYAQCLAIMHRPMAERLHLTAPTPDSLALVVNHIVEFSLAGIWAVARHSPS